MHTVTTAPVRVRRSLWLMFLKLAAMVRHKPERGGDGGSGMIEAFYQLLGFELVVGFFKHQAECVQLTCSEIHLKKICSGNIQQNDLYIRVSLGLQLLYLLNIMEKAFPLVVPKMYNGSAHYYFQCFAIRALGNVALSVLNDLDVFAHNLF